MPMRRTKTDSGDALDTRWWSLVIDENLKVNTIRNGSCGDPLLARDVPRIVRAFAT